MAGIIRDIWSWDAYGAASSLPAWADWNVLYPGAWSTIAITNPPWLPVPGTGYALKFTGANAPSGSTNPGAGVYSLPRWPGMQGVIVGVWVYLNALPGSGIALLRVNNSRTSVSAQVPPRGVDQSYLDLASTGVVTAENASNTSAGTYSSLSTGAWYFLEYFVFVGTASGGTSKQGSTQLSINGTPQITNTNCTTQGGFNSLDCDCFTLDGEFDQTAVIYWGPGYWMDANGGGAANMLGKLYFQTRWPTGAPGSPTFTSSDSNYLGDVTTVPPGAGYLYAATQGDQDLLSLPVGDVSGIAAVQVQAAIAQGARGGRMFAPVVKSGGTTKVTQGFGTLGGPNTAGGSFVDSTNFFIKRIVLTTDPNTGSAWAQAAANAATVGVEVFQ